jgi:hypothetical protein
MAKKKVKKFQSGGDARRVMSGAPSSMTLDPASSGFLPPGRPPTRPPGFPGGSGPGGATGAVGDVLTAGRQAQDFLGTAGQAIGTPQRASVLGPPYHLSKGGKVAKKKASGKVRGAGKARKGVRPVKMVKMKG